MNSTLKIFGVIAALIIILVAGSLSIPDEESESSSYAGNTPPQAQHHALLDEVVFTRETARGQMTELVASGSHQLAAQGISDVTTFRKVRNSDSIAYDTSYGSANELTFNVAGPKFADGTLNPFHVQRFREAINWLVDRQYIAEEIFGGLAVPRYLPISTALPDSARLAQTVRRLEVEYGHDPDRAVRVMSDELNAMGAEQIDGQWQHNGLPLTVKVLIRIEDQRRLVGDYIADLFHALGFTVDRLYRSADEASRVWGSGNPLAGEWHIYTGGWVSTVVNRDLAGNFNYYYTPRGLPRPLWQVYQPVAKFDDIAARLLLRDYDTWDERQAMMRRALELSMEDSSRVWLTDQTSAWARAPDVSMAVDLAGGVVSSSLWPFTLRYNDATGGRMKIAMPTLLTDPFNPIAGSNWSHDRMVIRGFTDSPVITDPFTGLAMPQQVESAEVIVRKDLVVNATLDWVDLIKIDEINVPPDAWIDWDTEKQQWITVAEKYPQGLTTDNLVRVRFSPDFLERRWHDGTQRSVADIVMQWILTFERADPASSMHDVSLVPAFTTFKKVFQGRRIVSEDPLIIETYGGPVYPDAETIAATRSPGFSGTSGIQDIHVPWHTLALAIRAESQGDLALSSHKADKLRVEWTNFVDGPSLDILSRHLGQALASEYLPYSKALSGRIEPGEIKSRYQSLQAWYQQRGHFWVGDGPYYLHAIHAIEGTAVLRPSPMYEEPVDKWLRYSTPRIPAFDIAGPMIVRLDEAAIFNVDIRFDGKLYPVEDVETVRYMIFDSSGALKTSGVASVTAEDRWRIELDQTLVSSLGVGSNRLEIAVTAKPVAMPTFGSHGFATVPGDAVVKQIVTAEVN